MSEVANKAKRNEEWLKRLEPLGISELLAREECPNPERSQWLRMTLCYSKIAFAVMVTFVGLGYHHGVDEEAKNSLYRYLKRVQATLLEFGLVYPLACVVCVEEGAAKEEVDRWASDQDWHRGDFTLHVETKRKDAEDCLVELLSLTVARLTDERHEPRMLENLTEDFVQSLDSQTPLVRELGAHIKELWTNDLEDDVQKRVQEGVTHWVLEKIKEARSAATQTGAQ